MYEYREQYIKLFKYGVSWGGGYLFYGKGPILFLAGRQYRGLWQTLLA